MFSFSSCRDENSLPDDTYRMRYATMEKLRDFYNGGYTKIEGGLYISSIDSLEDLHYLSNLKEVLGELYIQFNANLTSLKGLENLHAIRNSLYVYANDKLTSLDGLENLSTISKHTTLDVPSQSIVIVSNDKMVDLCGIKNLVTYGSYEDAVGISTNAFNPTVDEIIAGDCSLD